MIELRCEHACPWCGRTVQVWRAADGPRNSPWHVDKMPHDGPCLYCSDRLVRWDWTSLPEKVRNEMWRESRVCWDQLVGEWVNENLENWRRFDTCANWKFAPVREKWRISPFCPIIVLWELVTKFEPFWTVPTEYFDDSAGTERLGSIHCHTFKSETATAPSS